MYMFLPFLIALAAALSGLMQKTRLAYVLWAALLIITGVWFRHHATSEMALSF